MPTRSSKPRRDANQAAKHILDQLTGEAPRDEVEPPKVVATRTAGKIGGAARARVLTAEQRAEIARVAAQARWKKS